MIYSVTGSGGSKCGGIAAVAPYNHTGSGGIKGGGAPKITPYVDIGSGGFVGGTQISDPIKTKVRDCENRIVCPCDPCDQPAGKCYQVKDALVPAITGCNESAQVKVFLKKKRAISILPY